MDAARPADGEGLATVRTVAALRRQVALWRGAGESVGLVPTMGALHEGHLALLRNARARCRRTVASIFVNPTQFGPREDFAAYPRDEATDAAALRRAGCDLLFAPDVAEMYPAGFATTVSVAGVSAHACGPHRPGHFDGVATVVTKLLLMTLPDEAYFGEKDFQQLQVIRRAARDLDIPVEIVGVPTVREPDGLALSSRNVYLTPEERRTAPTLARVLRDMAARLAQPGRRVAPVVEEAKRALAAAGFARIDYLEVLDAGTLQPVERVAAPARIVAAVHLGRTRLIDNFAVP